MPTTPRDNAFLIEGDDGFTLVDVGWAKAPDVLARAVAAAGRAPHDIRRIVLTHAHPDHVQGAAELRRRTGAKVLIHSADAGWLQAGQVPAAGRAGRGKTDRPSPLCFIGPRYRPMRCSPTARSSRTATACG